MEISLCCFSLAGGVGGVGMLLRTSEGMKMYSFIGYKWKSFIIVQFSGFKLVSEKYHKPNLSEPDVGMQLSTKNSNVWAKTKSYPIPTLTPLPHHILL